MSTLTEVGIGGLRASEPETLPFGRALQIRAFVLERKRGNIAVYSTTTLEPSSDVTRQYLSHSHEALFGAGALGVPLFFHEDERAAVEAHPRGTFSRRHTFEDDFEVIPIPGHTPGATAYLWDSGEHRMLFTGDTILLDKGEWKAACSAPATSTPTSRASGCCASSTSTCWCRGWRARGRPYYAYTDAADRRRRIGAIIKRLQRGETR